MQLSMEAPNSATQLLKKAQEAQINGELEQARSLFQQYYSQRPFRYKYLPERALEGNNHESTPRLSIIVPCHNSEQYIEQCIDSILDQEFADFELIIVDDCSTDNSLSIIMRKALDDQRIVVIKNDKASGSAGLPRNQALKIAKGDLIGFVDSDDWVGPSYFQCLVNALDKGNADVVISQGFINHAGEGFNERTYPDMWKIKCSNPDLSCTHMSSMIWDKVYKKSLLDRHQIRLGSYPAAVDVPFILKVYHLCQNPVTAHTKDYHYRRETENSVTVKFRKGSSCDFELKAYDEIFEWAFAKNVPSHYMNFMNLKRLASFIYTCKLVKIDFFSSYFDQCSKILTKSKQDLSTKTLSAAGQRGLEAPYQLFLTNNKTAFIESQRPNEKKYLIENIKSQEYNVAKTIRLASKAIEKNRRNLVYFPDWSLSNPYQDLFYKGMQAAAGSDDINVIGLAIDEVQENNLMQLLNDGDIVHMHWVHPFIQNDNRMNLLCDLLEFVKAKKNALIVWTIHNTVSHECRDKEEELRRRRHVSQFCDRFIVHSHHAASDVERLYGVKRKGIYIVPHGKYDVDVKKCLECVRGSRSSRTKMRLTMLGELRAYKNVEYAVDLISRLNNSPGLRNLIELRIAGKSISQSQSDFLHNASSKNDFISLNLKRLSDEEMFDEFCHADFIFAPYSNLLTSGICINALSHGRPFIAPKFGSLIELHHASNSILYVNENELIQELVKCSNLFHRDLLHLVYDPCRIISGSSYLEWHNIFSSLDPGPFE